MRSTIPVLAVLVTSVLWSPLVAAQSSDVTTFIIAPGRDTLSLEQFTRAGNTITGVWISNRGQVQVHDFVLTLDAGGMPARYDMAVSFPDGAGHLPPSEAKYLLEFGPDSLTLTTGRARPVTQRIAMRGGVYPSVGASVLGYELGLTRLRAAQADTGSIPFTRISAGRASAPQLETARFIGGDSARVGTATFKVDRAGNVLGWRTASGEEGRRVGAIDVRRYEAALITADSVAESAARARLVTLPASVLDKLTGDYTLNPTTTLTVARENDKLTLHLGSRPAGDLLAESATSFAVGRAAGGQRIAFEVDSTGHATALVVSGPGGMKQRAPRVAH